MRRFIDVSHLYLTNAGKGTLDAQRMYNGRDELIQEVRISLGPLESFLRNKY